MKQAVIAAAGAALLWFGYNFFQSPEKYIRKKTKYLIQLSSLTAPETQMGLLSRTSKAAKYIHFDARLKAEYEGRTYTARSLNEFRSLFTAYLRQKSTGALNYKNLEVKVESGGRSGEAGFDGIFERGSRTAVCKILLKWIKEDKRWFIKSIDVFACSGS